MAEGKKSFVLYADLLKSISHLTNEEKGILFNHLLEYVNDKNPVLSDRLIITAWIPIELQLKRDLKKFEQVREKRSEAGKISAEKRKQQNQQVLTSVESVEHTSTNSTDICNMISDTDICNNVISETATEILLKKEPKEGINFSGLLGCINSAFSKKLKVINATTQKKFNARLKDGYSKDDIFNAITNASHDEFHKESNFKWCTPEYFSRSTTLDKYGFESQPVKAEKLIVPHYNENYPANLGDGTPA